jgi:hypothetical protein
MLQVNPVASRSIWIGGAGLDNIVAASLYLGLGRCVMLEPLSYTL